MKAGREHRVPLSTAALAVLRHVEPVQDGADGLVFPGSRKGTVLSNMAMMGIAKAQAEGKCRGRAPTARRQSIEVAHLKGDGVRPVDIARRLGIGRASVYRILGAAAGA
jgi:hypothetical protein